MLQASPTLASGDTRPQRLLFVVALLFAVLPTGLSWNSGGLPNVQEGSWVLRLQWTSLFLVAAVLAVRIPQRVWRQHAAANPFLILLVMWCSASMLWSAVPEIVVKRMVQFCGVLLIGIVVAFSMADRQRELFRDCLYAFFPVLFLSIVFAVFVPSVGQEQVITLQGSWRGILEQKNDLGIFSGLSILFFVLLYTQRVGSRKFVLAGLFLSLVCLIGCRSSTGATFTLTACLIYLFLSRNVFIGYAWRTQLAIVVVIVVFLIYFGYYFFNAEFPSMDDLLSPFSAIFGKATDLTGRSYIWYYMWKVIDTHPVIGMGYDSFWLGTGGPSQFISDELRWSVPSAHNGYMEIMNELGYIGLFLFFMTLLMHLRNLSIIYKTDKSISALHVSVFVIFIISNFSQSTALRVLTFLQMLLFFSMLLSQQLAIRIKEQVRL